MSAERNLMKTPYYSPYLFFFGPKLTRIILAEKDTIGKSISRGAEWYQFQLRSTFQ